MRTSRFAPALSWSIWSGRNDQAPPIAVIRNGNARMKTTGAAIAIQ
ncbi:MAG: hypothetical protein ACYTHK_06905 [Planctomycetota bacterium]